MRDLHRRCIYLSINLCIISIHSFFSFIFICFIYLFMHFFNILFYFFFIYFILFSIIYFYVFFYYKTVGGKFWGADSLTFRARTGV